MAVQISGNDITVPRDGTFSRNVSIAGTLTYEDVTNVDSIGLVTARNGIEVGASPGVGASISVDGNAIFSGITTVGTGLSMGDNVRANFGDGGDLQIYHSGSVDMIEGQSLYLIQESQNIILRNLAGDEAYAKFFGNGAVELYHNGTKQCETSANGLAFPSGKGIDFSAASGDAGGMSNELLDDYEEGTFTPSSSAVTLTGTIAGHYTKVGDLCYVSCIFQVPSTSDTNDVIISGLPFNCKNGSDGNFIQGGYVIYNDSNNAFHLLLQNNTNNFILYNLSGNRTTFDGISNTYLRLAATYKVA